MKNLKIKYLHQMVFALNEFCEYVYIFMSHDSNMLIWCSKKFLIINVENRCVAEYFCVNCDILYI